jgi:hypothetical protein
VGFIAYSRAVASSNGIARTIRLNDAVFAKTFYEIVNVSSDDLDGRGVDPADFVRNVCFVSSVLYELEDFRADNVEREHLPVTDIEKDSSIRGLCASK